jgi:hypothetical protein
MPLVGALASAIAMCQTQSPPTNVLPKQCHLCHPLFDLIVAFSCNTTSIPTAKPPKQHFTSPNLALFLVCMFLQKRNLFLQVTARSVLLFLEVPAQKELSSFFLEHMFLRILENFRDSCRNAQPSADTVYHKGTFNSLLEKDLTNELYAVTMEELTKHGIETYGFSKVEADLYAADIEEKRQAMENMEQQALCLDSTEAEEHLACPSMQPNHLFGDDLEIPTKKSYGGCTGDLHQRSHSGCT